MASAVLVARRSHLGGLLGLRERFRCESEHRLYHCGTHVQPVIEEAPACCTMLTKARWQGLAGRVGV